MTNALTGTRLQSKTPKDSSSSSSKLTLSCKWPISDPFWLINLRFIPRYVTLTSNVFVAFVFSQTRETRDWVKRTFLSGPQGNSRLKIQLKTAHDC